MIVVSSCECAKRCAKIAKLTHFLAHLLAHSKSLFVYIELKHGAMHAILGTIMIYNHTNAFLINNAGPARAFSSPLASAHAKLHTSCTPTDTENKHSVHTDST